MNTAIVAQVRYHRINAICFHHGPILHIATGVVEVDGAAYLGELRAPIDAPDEFTVAAFITSSNQMVPAPRGWEADSLESRVL